MAHYHNGFENIRVELVDYAGNDLAKRVCVFGQHAEFYTGLKNVEDYSPNNDFCKQIVNEIIKGVTFPKYALQGHHITFSIRGISRICLAQFTREGTDDTGTFFCSASSGTRPLTQDQIIPMNIYTNKEWMERYDKINKELEALYCDMLEAGIPFMDARYIMPQSQTIDICYTASIQSFIKSCKKRLDNCIADEINYLYRLMIDALKVAISKDVKDELSLKLWDWLVDMMDIHTFSTNVTYRNDFDRYPLPDGVMFKEHAHNDWRKSQWKMELERIFDSHKFHLLMPGEYDMICRWKNSKDLPACYDKNEPYTPETSIKNMDYYKEYKNGK